MSSQPKTDLRNFTQRQLVAYVEGLGQPAFRGRQIMGWLYRPGITRFSQMTDLAKEFRLVLEENARISRFDQVSLEKAADGCVKFAFHLEDGYS
ncbi:MAG TPA: 23S rRNA (adenine(2503)-C(2))-methyltransferase RlmN, partial [Desulforhopalus sp.]|nr:23S rRNA (adenine(2503)-C(2))-methyltransferase RlmN [Desulforhopalus sp.]